MYKKNILCFTDYFLPGFRGGGPIKTLSNLTHILSEYVNFHFVSRNHDLGSLDIYEDDAIKRSQKQFQFSATYLPESIFSYFSIFKLIKSKNFDCVYLNSFFSFKFSIFVVLLCRIFSINSGVIIAPRGEFSAGALSIKPQRKKYFLRVVNFFNLYKNIVWHASTSIELVDISNHLSVDQNRILVAPDPVYSCNVFSSTNFQRKDLNKLHLIFISRISPVKNLYRVIEILSLVKFTISLDIFGPIEDEVYWQNCLKQIEKLPSYIHVYYKGHLEPSEVCATFSKYDLFIFPTLGENFGHVIFESLSAGTPVLTSDRTPWKADKTLALSAFPNENISEWVSALNKFASFSNSDYIALRMSCFKYCQNYHSNATTLKLNLSLFGVDI